MPTPPDWLDTLWWAPDLTMPTPSCMACRSPWPLSSSANKTCWPASFCERIVWAVPGPLLNELHWLPVASRIHFKIATLTHKILSTGTPSYLSSLLSHYKPTRQLRSSRLKSPGTTTLALLHSTQLHLWSGMACLPMSGHPLRFRPSRKCSKLIISAALPPRSRACPAPQIRFDWPPRTLSLRPWRVFQIVIIIIIIYYFQIGVRCDNSFRRPVWIYNLIQRGLMFSGSIHARYAASLHIQSSWDDSLGSRHMWSSATPRNSVHWRIGSNLGARSFAFVPGQVSHMLDYNKIISLAECR